jgi:hypothetical protein
MRERAEGLLGSSQHEILLALMDKVKARDTSAIKLALEVTGRHVSQSTNGNTTSFDVQSIITRVVEIVIDEVDDQATKMRIAERLQSLVVAGQVTGQLPMAEPEIVKPELAAPRELTAEVRAMMDKGLGYDN